MAKKKKEVSVEDNLKKLYNLQLIDSEIDEIGVLKGELPIEVSDLEDAIGGLETRVNRVQGNIDNLKKDIAHHEGKIKESEALIKRYTKQMDEVKNNREYDALTKEQELQRLEIQLSEKKINEAKQSIDLKKESLSGTKAKLKQKKKDLEVKKVELKEIIEKTEKKEKSLIKKSATAKKSVEDRLLKAYEKIRSTYRNGLAVVTVERESCGGCFNKIPPQVQLEIGLHKKIIVCEHCGRILIDDSILNPEKKKEEVEG